MIRVAIADDSPFTCKLLASYVQESGDCEVVGFANDALSTIDLVRTFKPDVLTLDLQMPGGNGLDLLRKLVAESAVAVVVISGVTRRAAATTLHALELGAVDFVLKYTPGAPVSPASLKREIVAKVKMAAAAQPLIRQAQALPVPAPALAQLTPPAGGRPVAARGEIGVIVIGASTGGPRAIGELLTAFPVDFAAPFVIVQHLPAPFTAPFAAQLDRHTRLHVQEAKSGDRLEPGRVLVSPGSVHLIVLADGRIALQPAADGDIYRPSIDLAMTSAAESYKSGAVGVVLTGMGHDGAEGLKQIREHGGEAYVQDLASCVVPSMPKRALERAGADYVARPERIGQMLAARSKS